MEDQISENLIDIIKPFESAVDEISHKLKIQLILSMMLLLKFKMS